MSDMYTEMFKDLMRWKNQLEHEKRALLPLEFWTRFDREIETREGRATRQEVETLWALLEEYAPQMEPCEAWKKFRDIVDSSRSSKA